MSAADLLRQAHRPVVFSGAGISKESGIPTFREAMSGLWERFDPTELATSEAYLSDPRLVWDFYEYRRQLIRDCRPNAAHRAIVTLEKARPDLIIATQNVDGFHQLAGSRTVLPLHGNIMANRCFHGCEGNWPAVELPAGSETPPPCPVCGQHSLRPDVVWFGERLDPEVMEKADAAVRDCDLMLIIGTSGLVYPAAGLADVALALQKPVIEINPEPSAFSSRVTLFLQAPAAQVLPQVVAKAYPWVAE